MNNRCRGAHVDRPVLRPMGLRHRPRSLPDIPTTARRSAGLLQRAHDFWGISRYADVDAALQGHRTTQLGERRHPRSGHGRSGDAARHLHQRGPAATHHPPCDRLAGIHAQEDARDRRQGPRRFCVACLDPLVGGDRFDFVEDLGAELPMRTIGMLAGIPDSDQPAVREHANKCCATSAENPWRSRRTTTSPERCSASMSSGERRTPPTT